MQIITAKAVTDAKWCHTCIRQLRPRRASRLADPVRPGIIPARAPATFRTCATCSHGGQEHIVGVNAITGCTSKALECTAQPGDCALG